jgi:hypothetical protein
MNRLEPKIFVICLSAYKQDIVHGAWIKANQEVDKLYVAVQEMLSKSPIYDAELFLIHDYEGFGSVYIDKSTTLEVISSLGLLIDFLYENKITSYKHWKRRILNCYS